MAATQYQIFCRYYNENNNKPLTNSTNVEWISATDYYEAQTYYNSPYDTSLSPTSEITVLNIEKLPAFIIDYGINGNNIQIIKCDGNNFSDGVNRDITTSIVTSFSKITYTNVYVKSFNIEYNSDVYDYLIWCVKNGILKPSSMTSNEEALYNTCLTYDNYINNISEGNAVLEYAFIRPCDFKSALTDITDKTSDEQAEKMSKTARREILEKNKEALKLDNILYNFVSEQSNVSNPKFDMIFMYEGIATTDEQPIDNIKKYCSSSYFLKTTDGNLEDISVDNMTEPVNALNYADGSEGSIVKRENLLEWDMEVPYLYYEKMKRIKLDPWFSIAVYSSLTAAMTKAQALVKIYGIDSVKIGKVVPLDQYIKIV